MDLESASQHSGNTAVEESLDYTNGQKNMELSGKAMSFQDTANATGAGAPVDSEEYEKMISGEPYEEPHLYARASLITYFLISLDSMFSGAPNYSIRRSKLDSSVPSTTSTTWS